MSVSTPILFEVTSRRSLQEVEEKVTTKTNALVAGGWFIIFVDLQVLNNKRGKTYYRGLITAQRDPVVK